MARSARTPDELRAASEHLRYEIKMFDATARVLMGDVSGKESVASNAFLESSAIHARAFLHVSFPRKDSVKESDVLAADFFDDPSTWTTVCADLPESLAKVRERVNWEIAHLT